MFARRFDFDTPDDEAPDPPDNEATPVITVFDAALRRADLLRRCFRFRFERTWADYYAQASLSPMQMDGIARHAPCMRIADHRIARQQQIDGGTAQRAAQIRIGEIAHARVQHGDPAFVRRRTGRTENENADLAGVDRS